MDAAISNAWLAFDDIKEMCKQAQGALHLLSHKVREDLPTAKDTVAEIRRLHEAIAEALGEGGGTFTREDGTVLAGAELGAGAADEGALADFVPTVQSVRGMFESEEAGGEVALPLGRFSLRLLGPDGSAAVNASGIALDLIASWRIFTRQEAADLAKTREKMAQPLSPSCM